MIYINKSMKQLLYCLKVLWHVPLCFWEYHDDEVTVVYDNGFVCTTNYKCRWCGTESVAGAVQKLAGPPSDQLKLNYQKKIPLNVINVRGDSMGFKLPSKVFICGRTFEVQNSTDVAVAEGKVDPNIISINLKRHHSDYELENSLLHECIELVLMLTASLYVATADKDKVTFMFSHNAFQHVIVPECLSIIQQIHFSKTVLRAKPNIKKK